MCSVSGSAGRFTPIIETNSANLQWIATDYVIEDGGVFDGIFSWRVVQGVALLVAFLAGLQGSGRKILGHLVR